MTSHIQPEEEGSVGTNVTKVTPHSSTQQPKASWEHEFEKKLVSGYFETQDYRMHPGSVKAFISKAIAEAVEAERANQKEFDDEKQAESSEEPVKKLCYCGHPKERHYDYGEEREIGPPDSEKDCEACQRMGWGVHTCTKRAIYSHPKNQYGSCYHCSCKEFSLDETK